MSISSLVYGSSPHEPKCETTALPLQLRKASKHRHDNPKRCGVACGRDWEGGWQCEGQQHEAKASITNHFNEVAEGAVFPFHGINELAQLQRQTGVGERGRRRFFVGCCFLGGWFIFWCHGVHFRWITSQGERRSEVWIMMAAVSSLCPSVTAGALGFVEPGWFFLSDPNTV